MKLTGKVEPDRDTINEFVDYGYDYFELYLDTEILDNHTVDEIVEECELSNGEIATVHTPHIGVDTPSTPYYDMTDEIANRLDAVFVLDSNPISTEGMARVLPEEKISADEFGYENDPSVSKYYIKNFQLSKDYPIVFDTAHMHMSEEVYLPFLEYLLQNLTVEELPAIHLADGVRNNDGLPFGDGTVDIEKIVNLLDTYDYEGPVVLETYQEHQKDALDIVQGYLEN